MSLSLRWTHYVHPQGSRLPPLWPLPYSPPCAQLHDPQEAGKASERGDKKDDEKDAKKPKKETKDPNGFEQSFSAASSLKLTG
jgi:hypothetical protein